MPYMQAVETAAAAIIVYLQNHPRELVENVIQHIADEHNDAAVKDAFWTLMDQGAIELSSDGRLLLRQSVDQTVG